MNELARSGIERLRTEYRVDLDPVSDLEVILHIIHLARRTQHAGRELATQAILNPSRIVGNVILRRPSIGVQYFLRDKVDDWFSDDENMLNLSLAFAMVNAKRPEVFAEYNDSKQWRKAVRKWARGINCNRSELRIALAEFQQLERKALEYEEQRLRQLYGGETIPKEAAYKGAKDPADYGPMIEILSHEYGHDPEYWIWISPTDETEMLIQGYLDRQDQARSKSPKKAMAPNPDRAYIRNLREFNHFIQKIGSERQKHGREA